MRRALAVLVGVAFGILWGLALVGLFTIAGAIVVQLAQARTALVAEVAAVVVVPVPPAPLALPSPPPLDVRMVPRFWTPDGYAHGCPISTTEAYTARHIALDKSGARWIAWSDGFGGGGNVQADKGLSARDLAVVKIVGGEDRFAHIFRVAPRDPQPGDRVQMVGYDRDPTRHWQQKRFSGRIVEVFGGNFTYSVDPLGGASGSCVVLDDGSLIGIHVASINNTGTGVLVTTEWGMP